MCNLYTVRKSRDEVAAYFRARKPAVEVNLPDDILPGTPGMVIREADGARVLQSMVWGFPMRFASMKPGSKPKPVNNIADIAKFTCNDAMRPLHDRMPVLLLPDEFELWLHGSFDDLVALQKRCFPNELIEISPTPELWVPKTPAVPAEKATLI
jgi:putative SOS response-associated peptidase YedK